MFKFKVKYNLYNNAYNNTNLETRNFLCFSKIAFKMSILSIYTASQLNKLFSTSSTTIDQYTMFLNSKDKTRKSHKFKDHHTNIFIAHSANNITPSFRAPECEMKGWK